ncbi:hypothetical protein [Frankia canadensis]|uniref:hypothetical protein n=1 Tax=Frankia canadensis TaxID=1836972 RepID=UPI0014039DFE|nr:hypothetical protein [Frankia canadensis]
MTRRYYVVRPRWLVLVRIGLAGSICLTGAFLFPTVAIFPFAVVGTILVFVYVLVR